jgi:ClpP class serine protease
MKTIFHAMEPKILEQFIETKRELLEIASGMSAKERAEGRKEIMEAANLFDIPADLEDPRELFSVTDEGVAIIPISGKLTSEADICDGFFSDCTTYRFISTASIAADNDPSVNKIEFHISSGGGHVTGVDACGQVIAGLQKPTEGVVFGMAASAAFWLGSQMDSLRASAPTDFLGSIGVAIEFIDTRKREEAAGVKRIVLTSTDAPDKRIDIGSEEGQGKMIEELDAIHDVFVARVASGRGVSIEKINNDFGQGGVLIAAQAKKAGMIDSIDNEISSTKTIAVTQPPAGAGKTQEEAQKMETLTAFLAANPAAKVEYDANLKASADTARTEGETAGTEKMQATITAVAPFLNSKDYPAVIGETALNVLKGEDSLITLKASVAAVDAVNQKAETDAAATETDETGETVPTGQVTDAEKTEASLKAHQKRISDNL